MPQVDFAEASLLYSAPPAPLGEIDRIALRATIEALGFPVTEVRRQPGEYVLVTCDEVEIIVAGFDRPFPMDHFRGVTCTYEDPERQEHVLGLLAAHKASLTVLVSDRVGRAQTLDAETKEALCRETVDLLLATTAPELVFWGRADRLLTAAEAEDEMEGLSMPDPVFPAAPGANGVQPRRIGEAAPPVTLRPPALRRGDIDLGGLDFVTGAFVVRPKRPMLSPSRTRRPAHLCAAPELSADVIQWFDSSPVPPVTAPTLKDDCQALRAFLALDDSPQPRRIAETATGRASLYVMSATIGVFALPVGAAVLTYNALSGGSFRATSHAMALTGMFLAMAGAGMPNPASALTMIF